MNVWEKQGKEKGTLWKWGRKILRARDPGVCCENVSFSNVRSYIHEVSPIGPHKHELNKDSSNRHAKMAGVAEPMRPSHTSKNSRQLRKTESRRKSPTGTSTPIGYPVPNGQP